MLVRRLFSTLSTKPTFCFEIVNATHEMVHQLHDHHFSLAKYFDHTFKNKQAWRTTLHQLLLVKTACNKPVAFAGIETGDGQTIQTYIETSCREQVFPDKTCMLHALEVHPNYRKYGLQMLLWKKLCKRAQDENLNSIIWEPIKEERYRDFLNKFNIPHREHLLSKVIEHGDYFDGENTTPMIQEEVGKYFQIEQSAFAEFHNKLDIATKDLHIEEVSSPTKRMARLS